jgi:transcriptional regulator with PAS, ATPase and Fis domain
MERVIPDGGEEKSILPTPSPPDELHPGIRGTLTGNQYCSESSELELYKALRTKLALQQIIGGSPAFIAAKAKLLTVAPYRTTVLILGETGTGKEMFARAIHYSSPRARKPFVAVNCGAIPPDLVENELFGHQRGAFTGADAVHVGMLHEAEGGTLFLDEIDCLPPFVQVKLLRFLQEKEYRPLGSTKTHSADVRVIAATSADLASLVREGKLRPDLYHRLNIVPLKLPPLRERREDIPLLVRHFLTKHTGELQKKVSDLSPDAWRHLLLYDWPGNVRELENILERAIVLAKQTIIETPDLDLPPTDQSEGRLSFREAKAGIVAQFEKSYLQAVLLIHQGNIAKAARAARKDRRAFWQLMRKHNLTASRSPQTSSQVEIASTRSPS